MPQKFLKNVTPGLQSFELKQINEDGEFSGLAAAWSVDRGKDAFDTKAFDEFLGAGKNVAILWMHDPTLPIGLSREIKATSDGLWTKGQLNLEKEFARGVRSDMLKDIVDCMSVGYKSIDDKYDATQGVRRIKKATLGEYSLVTKGFAMNEDAMVHSIKSFDTDELHAEFATFLRKVIGSAGSDTQQPSIEEFLQKAMAGMALSGKVDGGSDVATLLARMNEMVMMMGQILSLQRVDAAKDAIEDAQEKVEEATEGSTETIFRGQLDGTTQTESYQRDISADVIDRQMTGDLKTDDELAIKQWLANSNEEIEVRNGLAAWASGAKTIWAVELEQKRNIDPNVGGVVDRDKVSQSDCAGKDGSYPIAEPKDVHAAAASVGRAGPTNYSSGELKRRIIAIATRKGKEFVDQLPEAWKDQKFWSDLESKMYDHHMGGGIERDHMKEEDFAGQNRSYPIEYPNDVHCCAMAIPHAGVGNHPTETLKQNIIEIAKRKGPSYTKQLPQAWIEEAGIHHADESGTNSAQECMSY